MKKTILTVCLIFFAFAIFCQTPQIDSLKIAIQSNSGETKVDLLNQLAKAYWQYDQEKSISNGQQALKLARNLKYEKGEAEAVKNIGGAYYFLGDYETALEFMVQSLNMRKEIADKRDIINALNNLAIVNESLNNFEKALEYYLESLQLEEEVGNIDGIASTLNNIGMIYENLSNYNKALEYFLLSLKKYEESGDLFGQASLLGNVGVTYGYLSNYDKAIEYHLKALSIYEKIDDDAGISTTLGNIGIIYDDLGNNDMALEYYLRSLEIEEKLGDENRIAGSLNNIGIIYDDLKNYEMAIQYYQRSLVKYQILNDTSGMANAYNNIGVSYKNLHNYKKSLEFLLKALEKYRELGRIKGVAAALNNVGTVYFQLNNFSKAEKYLNDGLKLAREIDVRDLIIEIYQRLSDVKAAQNDFESALNFYKMYSSVKDSIFSKEKLEIIAGMEATYEVQMLLEEREKEIEILQKDNEIYKLKSEKQKLNLWLLYFGLAIIIVLAFVIFYRYRLNKKATIELEKQVEKRTRDLREINQQLKNEIAERKALENQLIRSERLAGVGELAAGVAHEIRNPLGNISSSAQICLSKYKPQKQTREFLEIIQEESEKANAIIKGLLDFANPREVKLKRSDVCRSISNVMNNVNAHIINNKIHLEIQCSNSLPRIMMDAKWFEQAFQNLVLNAIQAMPNGGDLKVSVSSDYNSRELTILLQDSGVGISSENISKMFDPFFTTKEDGVGLGLSLCHQIISDHNGKISVESQVSKGTKISLVFPIGK